MGLAKVIIGALVVGGTAAGIAYALSGDADGGTTLLHYVGRVGARGFRVRRNGDTWAWETVGGSGAEPTPWEALHTVIGYLLPNASAADLVTVDAQRNGTALLRGTVVAWGPAWRWGLGDVQAATDVAVGDDATRGAATIAMLDAMRGVLEAREGVGAPANPDEVEPDEVDPDAPTVPIPPDPLPPQPPKPPGKTQPDTPDAGGWDPVEPPDAGGWELPNVHELVDAADLERYQVADVLDPDGRRLEHASMVVLGYDPRWMGRNRTRAALRAAAALMPAVTFVFFSFDVSRAAIGQPEDGQTIGYVASAVGPEGRARASVDVGGSWATPLTADRRTELVAFARNGPGPQSPMLFDENGPDGRYVVLVRSLGGSWESLVWRHEIGADGDAVFRQGGATRQQARSAALGWIAARPAAGAALAVGG